VAARPSFMAGRPDKWASRAQSSARALPYSSYKYHGAPPGRKCEESEVEPPIVLSSSFLYIRERGEVLRAGGLPNLLGVLKVGRAWMLCRNPFGFDGVFWALVRSTAEALSKFCEFQQRTDSSPSGVLGF
jgi:hypothetical protein